MKGTKRGACLLGEPMYGARTHDLCQRHTLPRYGGVGESPPVGVKVNPEAVKCT